MDKLTFKNYPPTILAILLCIIVALNFGFKILYETIWEHKAIGFGNELVFIVLSYSTVLTVLSFINKYCMWKWLLQLLGLCDLRGTYTGTLVSSYHVDNDPLKPHIQLFCNLQIIQNINAIKIEGQFYTDEASNDESSYFTSSWEEIKKEDSGNFLIRYFFLNKGHQLHSDNQKYGLTSHEGICVLTFYPSSKKMKGYYFNHERFSNGEIFLELQ